MDNTVLDKQKFFERLRSEKQELRYSLKFAKREGQTVWADELREQMAIYTKLMAAIESGQFYIPNPLHEENESMKRVLQDIATHVGDITSTQFYQDAYYEVKRIAHKYLQSFPKTEPNQSQQQVEDMKRALQDICHAYESEGTDIQVARKMVGIARNTLKSLTPTTEPSGAERLRDRYEMQECFANVNSKWYRKGILDAVNDLGIIIPGINAPKGEETV